MPGSKQFNWYDFEGLIKEIASSEVARD
uniref:Uncharacterized protein n=1 Tax=Rhizophora mucronata TaxID=61149 RepID=A0A2P2QJV8_RHIMU